MNRIGTGLMVMALVVRAPWAAAETGMVFPYAFDASVPNECTGETVRMRVEGRVVVDAVKSGGGRLTTERSTFHAEGKGLLTGLLYRLDHAETYSRQIPLAGGSFARRVIGSDNLIAEGSAPNSRIHFIERTTFNARGELTSFKQEYLFAGCE